MRRLSEQYLADLKEGLLSSIKELVQSDTSLCLEIRNDKVNVYYRGGNMMRICASDFSGEYLVDFDRNYFRYIGDEGIPSQRVTTKQQIECWLTSVPRLKRAMDIYFGKHRKDEREFQQRILRDNNFGSIADGTDYYICDIEYGNDLGQFDMIGVHWPSRKRRNTYDRRLVFVEVKHGEGAIPGKSGIRKHVEDINKFVERPGALDRIKAEMVEIFKQKLELNLINCSHALTGFNDEKPMLMLAFVNHNPNSTILRRELNDLPESPNVELCVATASFLGYGLYDPGIHPLDKARARFSEYIHQA